MEKRERVTMEGRDERSEIGLVTKMAANAPTWIAWWMGNSSWKSGSIAGG